jgi:hypothetical protein
VGASQEQTGQERAALVAPGGAQSLCQLAGARLPQQLAVALADEISMCVRVKHAGLLSPST